MLNINEYPKAERVFRFFEEISSIPRGSGNTEKIADYLVDFAKSHSLEYKRDDSNNVIIRKPAYSGYENRPGIIFQGHTDMVAEKSAGAVIDMEKEGLTLYRDGDFIRAKGTTLGGDDGVAVAYALAVLDSSDIPHPAFEAVFTSDEEIGLIGAEALDLSFLHGRLLINIDSDVEGIFTVGCAGGMRSDISMPVSRLGECNAKRYKLSLSGFKGGHSGMEIDKGRVNGIKALGEILSGADILICDLEGGNADNAIPRDASCIFTADDDALSVIRGNCDRLMLKHKDTEPDAKADVTVYTDTDILPLDKASSEKAISLLCEVPSGVIAMSCDIPGLVETSLNLGIMRCSEDRLNISFSVRSSKESGKRALGKRLEDICSCYGLDYSERGGYPAWEYRKTSHLRDVMTDVYTDMYKKSPEIVTIHAGLECGIFSKKLPDIDCVSIGPDNFDIHTPEERLSISSTVRVWEFLKRVLKEI